MTFRIRVPGIEPICFVHHQCGWINGLESFEHVSGEPGQPGAVSKLVFVNGRHQIELIETITERNLPDEFNGRYAWKGGQNTLRNDPAGRIVQRRSIIPDSLQKTFGWSAARRISSTASGSGSWPSMLMPARVEATLMDAQTRWVWVRASGRASMRARSPLAIPFSTQFLKSLFLR